MRRLLPVLPLLLLACTSRDGPVRQGELWQADGLVIERRGDTLLLIQADDGTAVELEVNDDARVEVQERELPSIQALFEGDRVRASWTGEMARGAAREVVVTQPGVDVLNVGEARRALGERKEPSWLDTFDSPGSTMTAPWYVGTWDYRPPMERRGPPHVNPITGQLVPSDARPGF